MSRKIIKLQSRFKRFVSVDDQDKLQRNDALVSGTKNVRTEAIGSVSPRNGSAVVHTSSLVVNPIDMEVYSNTDGVAGLITSDGKNIWATRTNTVKVGEFGGQGDVFRGQMAGNRLYMVNGLSLPLSLRSLSGNWQLAPVGVSVPGIPTEATGANSSVNNMSDPGAVPTNLGMYDLPNGSAYIYAVFTDHTIRRFNVSSNTWEDITAPASALGTPWGVGTFPSIGLRQQQFVSRWSDGTLWWIPGSIDFTNQPAPGWLSYFYDPSTGAWNGPWQADSKQVPYSNPIQTAKYWSQERNLVFTVAYIGSFQLRLTALVKSEDPSTSQKRLLAEDASKLKRIYDHGSVPANVTLKIRNAVAVPLNKDTFGRDWNALAFYSLDTDTKVNVVMCNFEDGSNNSTPIPAANLNGVTLDYGDTIHYNGTDSVFLVKAGTNAIWRGVIEKTATYKITWTNVTQLGSGATRNAPILGGQPNLRSFYYFQVGTDFVAETEPNDPSQTQTGDSIRIVITAVDTFGNESSASSSLTVSNVLEGGFVKLAIPAVSKVATVTNETTGVQSSSNLVSAIRIYRTLRNDQNGKLYYVTEVSGSGGVNHSIQIIDSLLDQNIEAPVDNDTAEAGQRFVTYYAGRLHFAKGSRIRSSKTDALESFPDEFVTELNPDDGDAITAMLRGNNLTIAKERSIFSVGGDLVDTIPRQVMFSDGNINEKIVSEMDLGVMLYSRKGLIFFDGYAPKSIDDDIEDLIYALRSQAVVHTSLTDEGMGIFYRAAGASQTGVLIYDMTRGHWVYDLLPYAISGAVLLNSSTGAVAEGLVAVTATGQFVRLYDPSYTTDNGDQIASTIVFRPFMSPDEYHEANWDAVTLDFQANGDYDFDGTLRVDEGSDQYALDSIDGNAVGRVDRTDRIDSSAVGRTGTFTFEIPRNATLNDVSLKRIITTLKVRERIPL